MNSDRQYLLALQSIPGLGPLRLNLLLQYFQSPEAAWNCPEVELRSIGLPQNVISQFKITQKKLDPEKYLKEVEKVCEFTTILDLDYPVLLKEISDPPIVLFYQGVWPDNLNKTVGVVGTRKVTSYGKVVTEKFSDFLSLSGVVIVSGLARGVDGIAHKAAISAGGQTIAVLGGGLAKIYPAENQFLADEILNKKGGIILSEFAPNDPSLPGNFPARNRIISGLSLGVLVTEAAIDSGSLITAKFALEQGREVFAIPGPINSDQSAGTLMLIKEGAKMVTHPQEILEELNLQNYTSGKSANLDLSILSLSARKIFDLLRTESKHIDELSRELKMSSASVSSDLLKMEINGFVKNLGGGNYSQVWYDNK